MDRNDSINLMKHTLSVRTLKNILSALDDDLKVVMASNYGDYTHTTQLVSIDDIALKTPDIPSPVRRTTATNMWRSNTTTS